MKSARREAEARASLMEQRIATLTREAEQARARLATTSAHLDDARRATDAAVWRERQSQARHVELVAQADAAIQATAILRLHAAERDTILGSTTWRLLSKAHRAAGKYPRAARTARTGAKLAYWTATLQLARRARARRHARGDIAVLATTALFDRAWYLARYPEVACAGVDPVMHYFWTGATAGYNPHPLFDSAWYLASYPDTARAGRNPLAHYVREGSAAGHDPHPLFDSALVLGDRARPACTVLEDYLGRAPTDAGAVNALFDGRMYLAEHPAARASGLDPLLHYVTLGAAAGYQPHPLFDAAWYSEHHPDSDAFPADATVRPLGHFLRVGLAAGAHCSAVTEAAHVSFPNGLDFTFAQSNTPDVSVIVPAYAHLFETYRCLCAVLWQTGGVAHEVILVDDRPDAPIVPYLAGFKGLRVRVNTSNLGFLRSCNEAAKIARGRYLVFLNNDTEVGVDWLAPMVAIAEADATVGMVGCKLLNPDGTIQEAGGIFRSDGWGEPYGKGGDAARGEYNFVRDVDCVTGACFLVPRARWEALGGFDDAYAPAFYEEFDLAVALHEAGLRVVYQPASEVTHFGSASYGTEARDRQSLINHARFCRKWARYLATRPAATDALFFARENRRDAGVVLVIDDKVPEPDRHAGALTLFQYLVVLRDIGLKVVYCPEDLAAHDRHVDHIWIARPSIAASWMDALQLHTGAPVYYYTHDLHYLREFRRFELDGDWWAREESMRLKRVECDIFARADVVLSPSTDEADIIRREVPSAEVRAIPPYLFAASEAPPALVSAESFADRTDIVFVGGFDHPPNVDAAIWLAGEIFPLIHARVPQARLVILGNRPPQSVTSLAGGDIVVTGYVPELTPYYERARMSVSPLRYGAGVKGKVVSSLQAGVPVVTTPIGGEGIGLRHGVDAMIGCDAAEIAACAINLFEDAELCARLASAGEAVVRERFSVAGATRAMRELFGVGSSGLPR